MDSELITVTIDGKEVKVGPGTTVLEAARAAGIHIPTLCHHDDLCSEALYSQTASTPHQGEHSHQHEESAMLSTPSSCRICLVEIEGLPKLHASCALPIHNAMTIRTTSTAIRHARRDILELMMSEHYGDCFACARNGTCELQKLCADYGVTSERFGRPHEPLFEAAAPGNIIMRDQNKCILCRRCVRMCALYQGVYALTTEGRGDHSRIATFMGREMKDATCINCGQCINRCPTGALTERDDTDAVWRAIEDPDKLVVIQTAPAPRAAIGEAFGCEPGTPLTFQMNTALKRIGFDKVFDTNFSADLTIMEEGSELISRLYKALVLKDNGAALPQFTSCSPGWIKFIEHFYPAYLPNLSSAKSPQQMMGAVLKTYFAEKNGWDPSKIVSVSLMPCTAKKFEAARPEMDSSGYRDVDYALTTRELARMFKQAGVELPKLDKSDFDNPFGTPTGSGVIFGATGGVMEAALRTVVEIVTGEKVETLFNHADITPVRGFDGVRMAELKIDKVGPVPAILSHLVPDFEWLKGAVLKVGIAHGTVNAIRVMKDIQEGVPAFHLSFHRIHGVPGVGAWAAVASRSRPISTSGRPVRKPSIARMRSTWYGSLTKTRMSCASIANSSRKGLAATRAMNSCTPTTRNGSRPVSSDFAELAAQKDLGREDLVKLLSASEPDEIEAVRAEAERVLLAQCGDGVYLRGLVEASNACACDCLYCGIRKSNRDVNRYTLSLDDILSCARQCADYGYGSMVIQSGERADKKFVDLVAEAVTRIKAETRSEKQPDGLGITLCIGQQSYDTYKRLYDAGGHRYLLRIETTNPALFAKIHPADQTFESRVACLAMLRDIGYQVGTGVMIGLPGQTLEDLADDILFFGQYDIDMIGMGPFIPHPGTPLGDAPCPEVPDRIRLALLMIAVTRLKLRDVNIASTTALQALDPVGREKGLKFGANVIMPQMSPTDVRADYQLYPGKPCLDENAKECQSCLNMRIEFAGRKIGLYAWAIPGHAVRRLKNAPDVSDEIPSA